MCSHTIILGGEGSRMRRCTLALLLYAVSACSKGRASVPVADDTPMALANQSAPPAPQEKLPGSNGYKGVEWGASCPQAIDRLKAAGIFFDQQVERATQEGPPMGFAMFASPQADRWCGQDKIARYLGGSYDLFAAFATAPKDQYRPPMKVDIFCRQ